MDTIAALATDERTARIALAVLVPPDDPRTGRLASTVGAVETVAVVARLRPGDREPLLEPERLPEGDALRRVALGAGHPVGECAEGRPRLSGEGGARRPVELRLGRLRAARDQEGRRGGESEGPHRPRRILVASGSRFPSIRQAPRMGAR